MSKESAFSKIVNHPDQDEIISKLVLNIDPKEINKFLKDKYEAIGDTNMVISVAMLKKFKDDYLDYFSKLKRDALTVKENTLPSPESMLNNNNAYRKLVEEYVDKEIDIKSLLKSSIAVMQSRIEQIYNLTQKNPDNTKPDYVLVQWLTNLITLMEKADGIINGSPDKIVQQNNINIQILDQHVNVFQNAIRGVISRLNQDEALNFVSLLSEEMGKLKAPPIFEPMSVDARLDETRRLASNQLDIPSF